jgi:PHD-finger
VSHYANTHCTPLCHCYYTAAYTHTDHTKQQVFEGLKTQGVYTEPGVHARNIATAHSNANTQPKPTVNKAKDPTAAQLPLPPKKDLLVGATLKVELGPLVPCPDPSETVGLLKTAATCALTSEEAFFCCWMDMCMYCGGAHCPAQGDLLGCRDCGEVFHPWCINVPGSTMDPLARAAWRCPNCKLCEVCCTATKSDDAQLVYCERCDRAYHARCLTPHFPLSRAASGSFICGQCVECDACTSAAAGVPLRQDTTKRQRELLQQQHGEYAATESPEVAAAAVTSWSRHHRECLDCVTTRESDARERLAVELQRRKQLLSREKKVALAHYELHYPYLSNAAIASTAPLRSAAQWDCGNVAAALAGRCPVCEERWDEHDDKMVECDCCKLWVHAECSPQAKRMCEEQSRSIKAAVAAGAARTSAASAAASAAASDDEELYDDSSSSLGNVQYSSSGRRRSSNSALAGAWEDSTSSALSRAAGVAHNSKDKKAALVQVAAQQVALEAAAEDFFCTACLGEKALEERLVYGGSRQQQQQAEQGDYSIDSDAVSSDSDGADDFDDVVEAVEQQKRAALDAQQQQLAVLERERLEQQQQKQAQLLAQQQLQVRINGYSKNYSRSAPLTAAVTDATAASASVSSSAGKRRAGRPKGSLNAPQPPLPSALEQKLHLGKLQPAMDLAQRVEALQARRLELAERNKLAEEQVVLARIAAAGSEDPLQKNLRKLRYTVYNATSTTATSTDTTGTTAYCYYCNWSWREYQRCL